MPDSSPEEIIDRTLGSSPAEGAGGTVPAPLEGGDNAGSPTAKAEDGKSLLEVLEGVLPGAGKSSAPDGGEGSASGVKSEPAAKEATSSGDEDDGEDLGEVTEEELSRYHSKTRRRIRGLVQNVESLGQEVETLRPNAEIGQKLVAYMETSGLDQSDVNLAMGVANLIRNDPEKALEALIPIVQQLQRSAGYIVPQDLQQQVQQGLLTEQHAMEIARARAREHHATERAERIRTEATRQVEVQQTERLVDAVTSAASSWESKWSASDPDYGLKQARVHQHVKLDLYENGPPASAQDAVQRLEKAKKAVDEEFRRLAPRPREMRPVTGQASNGATPKARSFEEAIDGILGQGIG